MHLRSLIKPLIGVANGVIAVVLPATLMLACGDGPSQLNDGAPGTLEDRDLEFRTKRLPVSGANDDATRTAPVEIRSRSREAATTPTWFTFVAMPDTQYYSKTSSLTPIFRAQVDWVIANQSAHRIAFVAHEGDVVDNGTSATQWGNAMFALQPLIAPDTTLPFALNRGNHDDPFVFVKNLGPHLYENRDWHVVVSANGLNTASVFQAGGRSFAHLGINMNPSNDDLAWANNVLAQQDFAGLPTIITTHDYLVRNGRSANGESIWQSVVKNNPQVFMVLNGHTHAENRMVSTNSAGKPVYQMLADYQGREDGGQGLMRLIKIDLAQNKMDVETFSPGYEIIKKGAVKKVEPFYERDADSEFSYSIDL